MATKKSEKPTTNKTRTTPAKDNKKATLPTKPVKPARKPTLTKLKSNILKWAEERGLTAKENVERQFLKLVEENGELAAALARKDKANVKDALGDIFVVWTILVAKLGLDHEEVIADVYDVISKRKGKTVDGVFVKNDK